MRQNLREEFLQGVTNAQQRALVEDILSDVHVLLGQYIRALALLAMATFTSYSLFLSFTGAPYFVLLAGTAALLEFIPVVGPLIAAGVILGIGLLTAYPHLLFVALTLWALRAEHPFVDVRLLARYAALTRTFLRFALVGLCVYVVLYGITQWLEAGRGMSALGAGLLLLPMSVISGVVVAPISRRNLVRGPVIVAPLASLERLSAGS